MPPNPNAKRVGKQLAYSGYKGPGMVRVKDELWMYGCEVDVPHDDPWYARRTPSGIHRYVQRLDGFVSLDAGRKPGTLTTQPFVLRGHHLALNADANLAQWAAQGSRLAVRVLDTDGTLLAESEPIRSNGIALQPTWKNTADLGAWINRPIQLQFTMRFAKLYAFQVVSYADSDALE